MSILTFLLLIILTCVAFWLFRIAYAHAGAIPEVPPLMKWAVQATVIVLLVVVICAIWGIGGGWLPAGTLRWR
jgi:hypothetical protein